MKWNKYRVDNIKKEYLFKFLSEENINRFLDTGDIWFSRADRFGDKMECVRVSDLKRDPVDENKIESRKKRTLISCWHLTDDESLAMWDTYSKTKLERKVCAIRFSVKHLNELIKSTSPDFSAAKLKRNVYGRIVYRNISSFKDLDTKKVKYSAFRKEKAFQYESEYRYVTQLNGEFHAEGLNYKLGKPSGLSFNILINPLLSKDDYSRLMSKFLNGNHSSKVKESHLVNWVKPAEW